MSIKDALSGGGWLLAIVVFVGGSLFGAGTEYAASPVENTVDAVAESPAFSPCPDGWTDTSTSDEHTPVLSCQRTVNGEKWLVVLAPDGAFDHATILDLPGAIFVFDKALVPGWPR